MKKKLFISVTLSILNIICFGQTTIQTNSLNYDPDKMKIIPDKVFEMGIPLLFIFLLLNTIVAILKSRAENQLKLRMVDKGVSEETLIKIFKESNAIARLQPLKWFLFTLATGVSLLIIHFSQNYLLKHSGYFAVGIILLFLSAAFLIYYNVLKKKI